MLGSWNTMPISARKSVMRVPLARIVPSVTPSRPAIMINKVLLPQPLGPRRQNQVYLLHRERRSLLTSKAVNPLPKTLRTRWQLILPACVLRLRLTEKCQVFCVFERTSPHCAGVNVTFPTASSRQNVSAFGGSGSFGAAAYCFTTFACSSILAKVERAQPLLHRFRELP